MGKGALLLLLALAAPTAYANAFADLLPRLHEPGTTAQSRTHAIDVGNSRLVSRTVTGVSIPLSLKAAGHNFGTARLIGGVDTSADDGTAVGGLAWQAGGPDGWGVGLGVLRTGLPTSATGGLLTQASLRLPLSFLNNAPSLGLALGSYAGAAHQGDGEAGRLSFATNALGGRYSVSYAQAQSGFRPLGSQLTANQTHLDLGTRYTLGQYKLKQRLRFQQLRPGQAGAIHAWRSDTFWGGPANDLLPLITTFRLHAGLRFQRKIGRNPSHTGWLLAAQGKGMYWQAWRLGTRLTLGRTAACIPANHAAWRLGGARTIQLGDFVGSLATHFGVALRTVKQTRWRLRSSLRLKMRNEAQQLSFGVHWIPAGWDGNAHEEPSWRVMFRYSIAAVDALPRLATAIGQLLPEI